LDALQPRRHEIGFARRPPRDEAGEHDISLDAGRQPGDHHPDHGRVRGIGQLCGQPVGQVAPPPDLGVGMAAADRFNDFQWFPPRP
jgi:hypothetical protein